MSDQGRAPETEGPAPYWSPYLAGFGLGLTLLASYWLLGTGLGASAAVARAAAWVEHLILPGHVEASAYFGKWFAPGSPHVLKYYLVSMGLGVLLGGFLSARRANRIQGMVERGPNVSARARLVLALCGGLHAWIFMNYNPPAPKKSETVARYEATAPVAIELTDEDPVLGPASAKARLIVFSDALCPHCKRFWDMLKDVTGNYGDDVRITFKHFPLDATCNPNIKETKHPNACVAARAMEAARMQGAPLIALQHNPVTLEGEHDYPFVLANANPGSVKLMASCISDCGPASPGYTSVSSSRFQVSPPSVLLANTRLLGLVAS